LNGKSLNGGDLLRIASNVPILMKATIHVNDRITDRITNPALT